MQALDVQNNPSRKLLQRLNSFSEEVDIVTGVMKQQTDVLLDLRYKLYPGSYTTPGPGRQINFQYERKFIDTLLETIHRQMLDYDELRERSTRLATENVQLVETQQDENSNNIFIFTIVTVIFLPLTFISGFFGMNLAGINGTKSTTVHFWELAVPITSAIAIVCLLIVFRKKMRKIRKSKR
jgi:Mg2+ and Co2+ transporter CorA